MPVGRVFDATQNQVLFSPVSNFYQGKAIRAGLAAQEQDAELKGLQIDIAKDELANAPNNRAKAEKLWQVQYDSAQAQLDSALIENGEDTMNFMAKSLAPITAEATNLAVSGDVDAGVEYFNREIQRAKSTFPKPIAEKVKAGAGDDGIYQPEEIANMKMMLGAWLEREGGKRVPRDQLVDGEPTTVFYDPAGNMFYEDGRPVLGKVTPFATNESGVIGTDPRTNSQLGSDYQFNLDSYNQSSDVQEMISNTLPQVIELPGTVGIRGSIGKGGAGLLSSLGQEDMAAAFSQWMSGASAEDIAQIQTQLQTIRGRIIPIVTGEQGKRLSETEREIASNAVGLIESIKGPADLTKAYPQVLGAMRQLYAESWATKYRLASRDDNFDYPYDLSDKDQRIELFAEFSEAGVDVDTAKRTVLRLKSIQGVE